MLIKFFNRIKLLLFKSKYEFFSINPLFFFYRFFLEKKIFLIFHLPRSGGTYIKTAVKNNYGRLSEKNSYSKIDEKLINSLDRPSFYISSCSYTEFDKVIEQKINKYILLKDPNKRIISLYFYLFNIQLAKKEFSENLVTIKKMNFIQFLNLLINTGNDNLLTRLLINKVSNFDFAYEEELTDEIKILTSSDYEIALQNLKKISIINSPSKINDFVKQVLKIKKNNYYYKNESIPINDFILSSY